MKNKYKEGQAVFAIVAPGVKLIVRRYVDDIYYCKLKADPSARELVYFERELSGEATEIQNRLKLEK